MSAGAESQITHLLTRVENGDPRAAEELLPLVYDELRRLARARLAKWPAGQTLQATALVHEAYLRVVGQADPGWNSRGHFFAAAAIAMRRILVEQARRKHSVRHGGGRARVELHGDMEPAIEAPTDDILAIDEALARLEATDARKGQIVNLRYFAGFTEKQVAETLDISLSTVEREWRYCRRWLYTQLAPRDTEPNNDEPGDATGS